MRLLRYPGGNIQGRIRCVQEIADVLNWDLPEADYRALARLPQKLGEAKERDPSGCALRG